MPRPSPKKSPSKPLKKSPAKKVKGKFKVETPFYIEAPLDKMNSFSRAVFFNVLCPFITQAHQILNGSIQSEEYHEKLLEVFQIAHGPLSGITTYSIGLWASEYPKAIELQQAVTLLQQHGDIPTDAPQTEIVQESRPPEARPIHSGDASQVIPALGVAPPAPPAYGVDPSQVAALGQGMGGMAPPGGPPRVMFTG